MTEQVQNANQIAAEPSATAPAPAQVPAENQPAPAAPADNSVAAKIDKFNAEGENDPVTGLPILTDIEKEKRKRALCTNVGVFLVLHVIALIIALVIFYGGETHLTKLAILAAKGGKDDGRAWPFLGVVIYSYMVIWLNLLPTHFKEQVMRNGNFRAN